MILNINSSFFAGKDYFKNDLEWRKILLVWHLLILPYFYFILLLYLMASGISQRNHLFQALIGLKAFICTWWQISIQYIWKAQLFHIPFILPEGRSLCQSLRYYIVMDLFSSSCTFSGRTSVLITGRELNSNFRGGLVHITSNSITPLSPSGFPYLNIGQYSLCHIQRPSLCGWDTAYSIKSHTPLIVFTLL